MVRKLHFTSFLFINTLFIYIAIIFKLVFKTVLALFTHDPAFVIFHCLQRIQRAAKQKLRIEKMSKERN